MNIKIYVYQIRRIKDRYGIFVQEFQRTISTMILYLSFSRKKNNVNLSPKIPVGINGYYDGTCITQ